MNNQSRSARDGKATPVSLVMVDALAGNDYSFCLCQGLSDSGLEVHLVTLEARPEPFPCTFHVHRWAPAKRGRGRKEKAAAFPAYLARTLKLLWRLNRQGPTVLHAQFLRHPWIDLILVAGAVLKRIPVVVTAHNISPHEQSRSEERALRSARRLASRVIVHTEHSNKALANQGVVDPDRVSIVPHGNFDHYRTMAGRETADLRTELGFEPDDIVVLSFGAIREYKGVDRCIEAFTLAADKNPSLRLVIAGGSANEALKNEIRHLADSSPVADRIVIHDRFVPSEEVARYLEAADLVALTYRRISHSGVLHLAYSFGKPVLVTDVADFGQRVTGDRTGFVAPSSNPDGIAVAMAEAASDRPRLATMGARARSISDRHYQWVDIGDRTSRVYDQALGLDSAAPGPQLESAGEELRVIS